MFQNYFLKFDSNLELFKIILRLKLLSELFRIIQINLYFNCSELLYYIIVHSIKFRITVYLELRVLLRIMRLESRLT